MVSLFQIKKVTEEIEKFHVNRRSPEKTFEIKSINNFNFLNQLIIIVFDMIKITKFQELFKYKKLTE